MSSVLPLDEKKFSEPQAAAAEQLEIARLEYGKFCTPEGPIEDMAGHRQLGRSANFPKDLIPFCDPTIVGISAGVTDEMPADDYYYGTILRPVVLPSQKVRPVLCRVRTRPEDGEGGPGRRYTLARYLVPPSKRVHPATLLRAMDSLTMDSKSKRLPGLTRGEDVTPLSASNLPPDLDQRTKAFLRGAIVYVLSGIPLCITEKVSEEEFFNWVAALWYVLPPVLRPYLSAGWRVESSFAGQLIVTHAAQCNANCALFSLPAEDRVPKRDAWTNPSVFATWTKKQQLVWKKFHEERLRAGYMYAHTIFKTAVDELPSIDSLETRDETLKLMSLWHGSSQFKKLPDFLDPPAVRAFRYPGLRAFDEYRLQSLQDWLNTCGAGRTPKYFTKNAQKLFYVDYQKKALQIAIEALGDSDRRSAEDSDRRSAGDEAVWVSFAGEPPPYFYELVSELVKQAEEGSGSHRAHLLATMQTSDHAKVLDALWVAAQNGVAGNLHEEVLGVLDYHLNATLQTRETLARHEQFLLYANAPPEYLDWVRRNAFDVLIAMLKELGSIKGKAARRVLELAPSPEVELICRWAEDQEPTQSDEIVVGGLNNERINSLLELVVREWTCEQDDLGKRREFLLKWLRMEVPAWRLRVFNTRTFRSDPLLPLAFRKDLSPIEIKRLENVAAQQGISVQLVHDAVEIVKNNLNENQIQVLVGDVVREAVPSSLEYELALLLLRRWTSIGPFVRSSNLSKWNSIFAWWVPDTALALLKFTNGERQKEITQEMQHEDESLILLPRELRPLVSDWFYMQMPVSQKTRMAKRYWAWAARSRGTGNKSTVVDLCRDLANRRMETLVPPESDNDFEIAVALTEVSSALNDLKRASQPLWSEAIQPWHLRLLLSLFPDRSFKPSTTQLGKLVYYRQWLQRHLDSCPPHGYRRKYFQLATKEFQEVTYPRGDGVQWNEAYINNSTIWAAFKGVPAHLDVNLSKALEAYDPTGQQHMSMCREYLMSYDSTKRDYYHALKRVLHGVLLPSFKQSGRDRQSVEKLFTLIRKDELSDTDSFLSLLKPQKIRMHDEAMHALIIEIVINGDRDFVSRLVRDFFETKRG
jgi:hypothetical protein